MKKNLLSGLMALLAAPLLAADASPKADVKNAAAVLGSQTNYSWRTTVEVGNNSRFRPGPTEGKTEKGGYTTLSMSFNDNTSEAVLKGTNGALKTPDNGWQSLAEAAKDDGGGGFNPTLFLARSVQNFKTPAVRAADLCDQTKDLKKDTNGISGDLTEDGAKALLMFRPRGGNGGGEGPTVSNAKGSAKFWLKDGKLTKFQFHLQGTVSFNGNDRDVDRTTTVEIKDVNSTKIEVPDEAKKKLQ
jgi:hypothetical protein